MVGGLRHFENVRPSARLNIGTRRLQAYYESSEDMRPLDLGETPRLLRGGVRYRRCSGARRKRFLFTVNSRRWCVFARRNLPTPTSGVVRAQDSAAETIKHLLVQCAGVVCRVARAQHSMRASCSPPGFQGPAGQWPVFASAFEDCSGRWGALRVWRGGRFNGPFVASRLGFRIPAYDDGDDAVWHFCAPLPTHIRRGFNSLLWWPAWERRKA